MTRSNKRRFFFLSLFLYTLLYTLYSFHLYRENTNREQVKSRNNYLRKESLNCFSSPQHTTWQICSHVSVSRLLLLDIDKTYSIFTRQYHFLRSWNGSFKIKLVKSNFLVQKWIFVNFRFLNIMLHLIISKVHAIFKIIQVEVRGVPSKKRWEYFFPSLSLRYFLKKYPPTLIHRDLVRAMWKECAIIDRD